MSQQGLASVAELPGVQGWSPPRRELWLRRTEAQEEGKLPGTPSSMFGPDIQNFRSQVQQGGPADRAGLENEDVIIEVNGENVQDEPYDRVVERIKSSRDHVTLLVCGKTAYSYFQAKKIPILSSLADPLVAGPDANGETQHDSVESKQDSSHPARERVSGDCGRVPCFPGVVPSQCLCFPQ